MTFFILFWKYYRAALFIMRKLQLRIEIFDECIIRELARYYI